MAIGDYRWNINGSTPPQVSGAGDLFLDLHIELCTAVAPDTWVEIEMGHVTCTMPGTVLLSLTASGTTAQKIAAIKAWITTWVQDRGVTKADLAKRTLISLLPGGVWPAGGVQNLVPIV